MQEGREAAKALSHTRKDSGDGLGEGVSVVDSMC